MRKAYVSIATKNSLWGTSLQLSFFLLLADDNTSEIDQMDAQISKSKPPTADPTNTYFQLSPQAVTGQFSPQTLKFQGIMDFKSWF